MKICSCWKQEKIQKYKENFDIEKMSESYTRILNA